jgi:RNA polymerase sigma factor (sigma-70 family)
MSEHSITLILNQLRQAVTEDDRQAAAAELYRCYRGQVERVARGRLMPGGGLADEEDVAQSAFRSFFDRIETGQLDALVTGGQAWAILARLTRNKAIDSVRYDNAICRGGEGLRRPAESSKGDSNGSSRIKLLSSSKSSSAAASPASPLSDRSASESKRRFDVNRLSIGDPTTAHASSSRIETPIRRENGRREDTPLDGVRDRNQRSGEEQAASKEAIAMFLEQLSEATLRGIVSLKLHGFTNEEIAEQLGCATRTIERKLNLIRRLWIPILENSDEQRRS